jgi:hypothetical protein
MHALAVQCCLRKRARLPLEPDADGAPATSGRSRLDQPPGSAAGDTRNADDSASFEAMPFREVLAALGADVDVRGAPTPALVARIAGPLGEKELR